MKSKIEKWYPIALGLMATVFCCLLLRNKPLPNSLDNIFSTAATLSSISVGFLTTAMSILFTINNINIVKQLKNTNAYTILINYFIDAIRWSFLLAVLSLIGLFFDFETVTIWQINSFKAMTGWQIATSTFFAAWILSLITSGLSAYRVIEVFANVLRATNN